MRTLRIDTPIGGIDGNMTDRKKALEDRADFYINTFEAEDDYQKKLAEDRLVDMER